VRVLCGGVVFGQKRDVKEKEVRVPISMHTRNSVCVHALCECWIQ